jgi:hypothetical protein
MTFTSGSGHIAVSASTKTRAADKPIGRVPVRVPARPGHALGRDERRPETGRETPEAPEVEVALGKECGERRGR